MRQLKLGSVGLLALAVLPGCASLPITGPTGREIARAGHKASFSLLEVASTAALPSAPEQLQFAALPPLATADANAIARGDVLSMTIYEVGVRLFSGVSSSTNAQQFDPSAKGERISGLLVDDQGIVKLPYVGEVKAAGLSTAQLSREIERRLAGKSELPQVNVQIDQPNGSAVIISGEVNRPGRVPLTGAHERLLDIITIAGGYRGRDTELDVRVERGGEISEGPLSELDRSNLGGLTMQGGDRVNLIYKPRTYSILGSASKVDQFTFTQAKVSLVEAIAKAGGMNDNLADPAAVFVFRFEPKDISGDVPTVYHMNMMKPASYLLAQKFMLHDKDVIYVGSAAANRPSKLVRIISEIFTPVLLTRQLTQ